MHRWWSARLWQCGRVRTQHDPQRPWFLLRTSTWYRPSRMRSVMQLAPQYPSVPRFAGQTFEAGSLGAHWRDSALRHPVDSIRERGAVLNRQERNLATRRLISNVDLHCACAQELCGIQARSKASEEERASLRWTCYLCSMACVPLRGSCRRTDCGPVCTTVLARCE